MAIVNNTCTEIGDVLLFEFQIPIIGLLSLSSFTDVIIGETATRYFKKEFRYSLDGINFGNWNNLTNSNLSLISVTPTDYFYVKYRYTREGIDDTGDLTFESITLNGIFSTFGCGQTFVNSIFANYVNCPDNDVLGWCLNVTKKLYYEGIVPNYILRRVTLNINEDKDYLDFWKSIACFFAMIVIYGRRILENFRTYEELLKLYLKQKNLYFCNNTSLIDLNYLVDNYYDEIRQRGTNQIYKEKSSTQLNLTSIYHTKSKFTKLINGELLRLICYTNVDELIFNLTKKEYVGWTINRSSPLFKGLHSHLTLNKAYEDNGDVIDSTLYPILNSQYISIEEDENKKVLKILNVPIGTQSGIGSIDLNKSIKVNENLNYQITFWVKFPTFDDSDSDSTSDSWVGNFQDTKFTFGVIGLDENNNQINLSSVNHNGGPITFDYFFQQEVLNKGDKYYFIRGIIYNKNFNLIDYPDFLLNIGFGKNLKFEPNIIKIIPVILIDGQISNINCLYIWNLQVKPLSTPFSTEFIQIKNFIEIWLEKNNYSLTEEEIEEIMKKYLLPYNCIFKNIWLEDNYDTNQDSISI
jgi:hypothetical protein